MRHDEYLLLDSSIRDWVVFPILFMLIIVGLGRHYVQTLIKSEPKVTLKEVNGEIRHKQILMQAMRYRLLGNRMIRERGFDMRKDYMIRKKTGVLREKLPPPANPMSNPMAMLDMMKGNVIFMVPNIAMMTFVGYFFSGFVCLKVPFPMPSNHFKLMLQRGVDLSTLNVSYVSSLCWYFLGTFCLNGVYMLLLGGEQVEDIFQQQMQMQSMGMMGGGGQPGFDAAGAFKQERELMNITKYEFEGDKAEKRLLGDKYPDALRG